MKDPGNETWGNIPRIYTICAWGLPGCIGVIHDGDRSSGTSHGLCESCLKIKYPHIYKQIREQAGRAGD